MEGDEGRVEEREREDGWNILKLVDSMNLPLYSTLLSLSFPLCPKHTL